MLKRLWLTRVLKFIALLVPIAAMVLFSQSYLFYHSDYSTERVRGFYQEAPHSLDVVILGASDVYNGYSPVYAYEYGGFTSYLYAWGSIPGSLYIPAIQEILARQNPQLILVEIEGFVKEDPSYFVDESKLRTFVENTPVSVNTLRAIRSFECDDKLSCFVPFFKYHGNWTDSWEQLTERFNERVRTARLPSVLKGATTFTAANSEWPEYEVIGDTTSHELLSLGEESLIELLEFCREQQLDNIVFVRFPHKIMNDFRYLRFTLANRAGEIIREYGFPFLDMEQLTEEMLLDFECDYYDSDHMNIYGQLKLTEYLSTLITDEYGVKPMEQTPENRAHWDSCIPYSNAYVEIAAECVDSMQARRLQERPGHLVEELEARMASWEE